MVSVSLHIKIILGMRQRAQLREVLIFFYLNTKNDDLNLL